MPMRFRGHAANRPLDVETDESLYNSLTKAKALGYVAERDLTWADRMIDAFKEWGSWTPAQRTTAENVRNKAREAYRAAQAAKAAPPDAPQPPRFQKLWQTFDHARERLQRPMLRFKTASGHKVQIFFAPATERFSAGLLVKVSGSTTMKISRDGRLFALRGHPYERNAEVTAEVNAILEGLDKDPAEAARDHGMATKHCVFCARALSDPRSLAMGYGPDCAANFALPWGEETTRATEIRCD